MNAGRERGKLIAAQEGTVSYLVVVPPLAADTHLNDRSHYPPRQMTTAGDDTAELLGLIADSRLTGYLAVASLCVLIYEHIVCFPQEVELMWNSRWGLAKVVYLWNRYFSLIAIRLILISVIVREIPTATVQGITSTIIIATVDFVLMLRVWIMYGRPRLFIALFAFLGFGVVAVDFIAYAQMKEYVHLGYVLRNTTATLKFLQILGLPLLTVLSQTFIMFAMTLYKCVSTLWSNRNAPQVMPVWRLFLRDGVSWFLAVFAAAGAALLIWTMRRETLKQLLVVVYSTVASRALLNIKAIMTQDEPQPNGERSDLKTGENIAFASFQTSSTSAA
ncbi:hypothetical protein C8R47DRAFT_1171172 [Mycena vitilis]|nr:hypothetical protein C8R47DRAFT_1171172 [Mycena vitilis]